MNTKKNIKIFFITTELPSRMGGANVRNFNIIKNLKDNNYDITLFTILDNKTEKLFSSIKKELGISIYYVNKCELSYFNKTYYAFIKKVIPYMKEYELSGLANLLLNIVNKEKPDIIQIEQLNAYYAIRKIITYLKNKNIKIILDQHNIEYIAFSEGIKSMTYIKKILGFHILSNLKKIEINALKNVDHILVCSDVEQSFYKKSFKLENITVIPNGVDFNYFKQTLPVSLNGNTLLFMGGCSYPPNNEGLRFYFSKIHPIIKKSINNYSIYILGGKSPKWLVDKSRKDQTIRTENYVPDVRTYLNKSKICICPILSGSGTRLKILEYLASRKAVVSTSKGTEGIKVTNGRNILLADLPDEFANHIIRLFTDQKKYNLICKEGEKLIIEKYQWQNSIKKIENVYNKYEK